MQEKSSFIQIKSAIDFPMTRERYLATWKVFRAISDENKITARHLLSLDCWDGISSILDLGCGDGLILKEVVLNSPQKISRAILIDPDKQMLEEAEMHLKELALVEEIIAEVAPFEDSYFKYSSQVDIILAIHLVYLIERESFHYLLDALPIGKKLIVVLDDEDSVFTKIWKQTAFKYAERSAYVRSCLNNLSKDTFSVNKTVITSKLINPLNQRFEVKEALLSLMSYSDFLAMDAETREYVEECIRENSINSVIGCKSACYEIVRVR